MSGRGCVAWGGKKKIELKKKREGDGRSPNMVGVRDANNFEIFFDLKQKTLHVMNIKGNLHFLPGRLMPHLQFVGEHLLQRYFYVIRGYN